MHGGTQFTRKEMKAINVTEIARNTREILDWVACARETMAIERNHALIAHIVPSRRIVTVAQALASLSSMLTAGQGVAWLNDSKGELNGAVRDSWAGHDNSK
jgi:hypothetical protein